MMTYKQNMSNLLTLAAILELLIWGGSVSKFGFERPRELYIKKAPHHPWCRAFRVLFVSGQVSQDAKRMNPHLLRSFVAREAFDCE